ncbi:MAG TPA: histidine kinase [Actinomycetota bacterium]
MSARVARWLAWVTFGLFVVIALSGSYLQELNVSAGEGREYYLLAAFIVFAGFGAFIASRVPRNAIGWLYLAVALLVGLGFAGAEYAEYAVLTSPGSLPAPRLAGWFGQWTWLPAVGLIPTFLFLLFPDGHLPSRRWLVVAWLSAAVIAAMFVLGAFTEGPMGDIHPPLENPVGFLPNPSGSASPAEDAPLIPALLLLALASIASVFFRYRRASIEQRQQLKWFLYAGGLVTLSVAVGDVVPDPWSNVLFAVMLLSLPVATAVAILKYRLYDVDVVINKTVVYGMLAAFVTLVYVGIVVGIGSLVGSRGNVFLTILATAIIALAFQPARVRARRLANRLVYGKRATPYEVLSRLAHGMGSEYSADDALPSLARVLGEGTGAARAEVWLRVGSNLRAAASWPDDVEPRQRSLALADGDLPPIVGVDLTLPVKHEGELLGALAISMPRGETVTPDTERLLGDVASQAGLVLRNVRLIAELRASRQRLVAAQDEERRRLERNIHDGAQQQLVALSVKVRLAETLAGKEPEKAAELMAQVRAETQQALDELRDLARGIYPPLLADKGLAAALEAQARKVPFPVRVEPNGIGRYPPETEANAYFCVLEALQNAAKYAAASAAVVRLSEETGHLLFVVSDDGVGFDPETTPRGSGLQNMADRLEALGGTVEVSSAPGEGTTVRGRIPVQAIAADQAFSSRSGSNSDLGM